MGIGQRGTGGTAADIAALGCGLVALALLGAQIAADPASGMSYSHSPFTDEGWTALGARNLVLLGRWATDEWQLYLAQLPHSVTLAAVFEAFGVGIIQARAVSVVASALAVGLVTLLVARRFGAAPGVVAGVGLAASTLFLYYGRLAILEPLVVVFLVAGLAALAWATEERWLVTGLVTGACLALALGTKPSSAAAAAGIVAGAVAAGGGSGALGTLARRAAVALAVVTVLGVAWWAFVRSMPGAWDAILRTWPNQVPDPSLGAILEQVATFPAESDGAMRLAAPLLVTAAAGVVVAAARWRSLATSQRVVIGACVGWFVLGIVALLVVPYRPNRYVVPLLPPLAILAGVAAWGALPLLSRRLAIRAEAVRAAAAAVVALVLAVQGLAYLARWTANATYDLPRIQEELVGLMTDGHAVQGAGPTFAMRVPVPTIVVRTNLNVGDSYADHGVRWLLTNRTAVPTWAEAHAEAWAARTTLACYPWPSGEACLIRVP